MEWSVTLRMLFMAEWVRIYMVLLHLVRSNICLIQHLLIGINSPKTIIIRLGKLMSQVRRYGNSHQ